jgi:hypothetical protein
MKKSPWVQLTHELSDAVLFIRLSDIKSHRQFTRKRSGKKRIIHAGHSHFTLTAEAAKKLFEKHGILSLPVIPFCRRLPVSQRPGSGDKINSIYICFGFT